MYLGYIYLDGEIDTQVYFWKKKLCIVMIFSKYFNNDQKSNFGFVKEK